MGQDAVRATDSLHNLTSRCAHPVQEEGRLWRCRFPPNASQYHKSLRFRRPKSPARCTPALPRHRPPPALHPGSHLLSFPRVPHEHVLASRHGHVAGPLAAQRHEGYAGPGAGHQPEDCGGLVAQVLPRKAHSSGRGQCGGKEGVGQARPPHAPFSRPAALEVRQRGSGASAALRPRLGREAEARQRRSFPGWCRQTGADRDPLSGRG